MADQPLQGNDAAVNIARCPVHGLHGERSKCFVCGGEVEQGVAENLATALRKYGDHAIDCDTRPGGRGIGRCDRGFDEALAAYPREETK